MNAKICKLRKIAVVSIWGSRWEEAVSVNQKVIILLLIPRQKHRLLVNKEGLDRGAAF